MIVVTLCHSYNCTYMYICILQNLIYTVALLLIYHDMNDEYHQMARLMHASALIYYA